jgi:ketosteroid isomerase-like protein
MQNGKGEAAMTEHPNVELTRRGYEAFAKADLAALAELIADDVTWHAQGVGSGWTSTMCWPTTSTP